MIQTTVDKLADLWILDMLECLRLDALGDLSINLGLVRALGVRIVLGNLSIFDTQ